MFKLHVIQAQYGDSLLLEFGDENSPSFILIDGGPPGVYNNSLRRELVRIMGDHAELEAVIVSHVDIDHIKGILDFLAELQSQKDNGEAYFIKVKQLWLNTFTETIDKSGTYAERLNDIFAIAGANNVMMASSSIALNGVKEGDTLTRYCSFLEIPLNPGAYKETFMAGSKQQDIVFSNLTFCITGPTPENLKELKDEWEAWLAKQEKAISDGLYDILSMSDKSIPNLSSISFVVNSGSKTILFTGDCRGDHLFTGLKTKGLLKNGKYHVNVLKVPHHGSDRNQDLNFFRKITADTYVISANGKHGNPDFETLEWIVKAAHESERSISIIVTNKTESTQRLVESYPPAEFGYTIDFIADGAFSIEV